MKTAILYSSSHGKTRKVVDLAVARLGEDIDVYNVRSLGTGETLHSYELLLVFSPTYGDEELQEDMEGFLRRLGNDLGGRSFAVCELGSYYGYDNFAFGALRIIRRELLKRNACELAYPLSLDSYPTLDTPQLFLWLDYLRGKMNEN